MNSSTVKGGAGVGGGVGRGKGADMGVPSLGLKHCLGWAPPPRAPARKP